MRRFVKAKTRAVSGGVLEDMDMRVRRVVLARLEWSGGGLVYGGAPGSASRSDAFQMCLRRCHAAVPPSPHVRLATVAGQGA